MVQGDAGRQAAERSAGLIMSILSQFAIVLTSRSNQTHCNHIPHPELRVMKPSVQLLHAVKGW